MNKDGVVKGRKEDSHQMNTILRVFEVDFTLLSAAAVPYGYTRIRLKPTVRVGAVCTRRSERCEEGTATSKEGGLLLWVFW